MSLAFVGYLSTLCTGLLLLSHITEDSKVQQNHEACLFIFGDSIVDGGTNNYIDTVMKGNVVPFGESFFSYPTGRFSDGRLIPDFIVGLDPIYPSGEYAGLPLLPPYLQPNYTFNGGVNFASAGSGALVETDSEYNVLNLGSQFQQLEQLLLQLNKEVGYQKTNVTISKSVYLFNVGGNDLAYAYRTSTTDLETIDRVIGNITNVVKSIYSKGGRKFGFINLMPLGCTPYYRATTSDGTCQEELNVMARSYNIELPKAMERLQTQLDGFKYSIFDFYNTLLQRINYPSEYGADIGTVACCGSNDASTECGGQTELLCEDPSKYVFFDCFHPTQPIYKQIAELMWNGGKDVSRPNNLRSLFEA